jgi:cytoskeletal protein CcmA (bactofilin family)
LWIAVEVCPRRCAAQLRPLPHYLVRLRTRHGPKLAYSWPITSGVHFVTGTGPWTTGLAYSSSNKTPSSKGEIRNGGRIEVFGYIEGDIAGDLLVVQPGGRCFGNVKVESADIHGTLQGEVFVRQLITIRGSGSVNGNIKYGRLAMEIGGNLTAELRNVPPSISGDLDLSVDRGRAVRLTLQDLSALDPDDTAEQLTFTVRTRPTAS